MDDTPQETPTVRKQGKGILAKRSSSSFSGEAHPEKKPCEKLEGCEPPKDSEFPVSKWCDLQDLIDQLMNAKSVEVFLYKEIPGTLRAGARASGILSAEKGEFLVVFAGLRARERDEKNQEEDKKKHEADKTKEGSESRWWDYNWWEYKEPYDSGAPLIEEPEPERPLSPLSYAPEEPYVRPGEEPGHPTFGAILEEGEESSTTVHYVTENKCPDHGSANLVYDYARLPGARWGTATTLCGKCGFVLDRSQIYETAKRITEKRFEHSLKEARRHLRLFTDFIAEVNKEWFNAQLQTFNKIEKWFKGWPREEDRRDKWPFPTIPFKQPIESNKFTLKCPSCKARWVRNSTQILQTQRGRIDRVKNKDEISPIPLHTDVKKTKCPKCKKTVSPGVEKFSGRTEFISSVLDVTKDLVDLIKKERKKPYKMKPLQVTFNLDQPQPATEIEEEAKQATEEEAEEKKVLHKPEEFKKVAEALQKHLQVLENCGVTPRLVVRGYADISGSCQYNLDLSERRAQWVVDKLKNSFGLKLPEPVEIIHCGAGFADSQRQESERYKDRLVIIQLYPEEKSEEKGKQT